MPEEIYVPLHLDRQRAINRLAVLRREWLQAATGCRNLLEIQAPVFLLMHDLLEAIGLDREEQAVVLGHNLISEVNQILNYNMPTISRRHVIEAILWVRLSSGHLDIVLKARLGFQPLPGSINCGNDHFIVKFVILFNRR